MLLASIAWTERDCCFFVSGSEVEERCWHVSPRRRPPVVCVILMRCVTFQSISFSLYPSPSLTLPQSQTLTLNFTRENCCWNLAITNFKCVAIKLLDVAISVPAARWYCWDEVKLGSVGLCCSRALMPKFKRQKPLLIQTHRCAESISIQSNPADRVAISQ